MMARAHSPQFKAKVVKQIPMTLRQTWRGFWVFALQ